MNRNRRLPLYSFLIHSSIIYKVKSFHRLPVVGLSHLGVGGRGKSVLFYSLLDHDWDHLQRNFSPSCPEGVWILSFLLAITPKKCQRWENPSLGFKKVHLLDRMEFVFGCAYSGFNGLPLLCLGHQPKKNTEFFVDALLRAHYLRCPQRCWGFCSPGPWVLELRCSCPDGRVCERNSQQVYQSHRTSFQA